VLRSLFTLENIRGALITMPHKVSVVDLLDEVTPTVKVAGACNAVRRTRRRQAGGRHVRRRRLRARPARKGLQLRGARALVVGCGGVGSAIAASLAAAGVSALLALFDVHEASAEGLGAAPAHALPGHRRRHRQHRPGRHRPGGQRHAAGHEPRRPAADAMDRLEPRTFVGEVVMKTEMTPSSPPPRRAAARCRWAPTCCSR
jgi:shikimate dehydrogenase